MSERGRPVLWHRDRDSRPVKMAIKDARTWNLRLIGRERVAPECKRVDLAATQHVDCFAYRRHRNDGRQF